MLKRFYDKIPSFLKNKYFLTGLVFLIWLVFFDRNNLISQFEMRKQLKGLKNEAKFYKDQYLKDSAELYLLEHDSVELERLGREKYMMKRDSEDIFLIVRKPASKK